VTSHVAYRNKFQDFEMIVGDCTTRIGISASIDSQKVCLHFDSNQVIDAMMLIVMLNMLSEELTAKAKLEDDDFLNGSGHGSYN
jgi:hypothetical protein